MDFPFVFVAKLQRDQLFSPGAHAMADIVAADDEVLAVVGLAADQQMDVRIVGVPVLGGDPVEGPITVRSGSSAGNTLG